MKFGNGKLTPRGEMVLTTVALVGMAVLYILAQTVMGC